MIQALLKRLLHARTNRLERSFDYDASYLHEIVDESPGAALRLAGLDWISGMTGPSAEIWAGAALASALDGDSGPCAQLVVERALRAGAPAERLRACLAGDLEAAGAVGLGFRFAEAAIAGRPEAHALRSIIVNRHGRKALIAASCAAATIRAYPVLRRALGQGAACRFLKVEGVALPALREAS